MPASIISRDFFGEVQLNEGQTVPTILGDASVEATLGPMRRTYALWRFVTEIHIAAK
jgi:hypothetical protein